MKIKGVGIDLVEVSRIRAAASRNPRFLKRIFTDEEIRYCSPKKDRWRHFAARFAAKEAVWKSLGRRGIRLRQIEVVQGLGGKPAVRILEEKAGPTLQISLSHCGRLAAAIAIATGR